MHVKSAYVLLPAIGNPRTGHNVMDKMTYKFDVVMKSYCSTYLQNPFFPQSGQKAKVTCTVRCQSDKIKK